MSQVAPRFLLVGSSFEQLTPHLPSASVVAQTPSCTSAAARLDSETFDLIVCSVDAEDADVLVNGDSRVAWVDGERLVATSGMPARATVWGHATELGSILRALAA